MVHGKHVFCLFQCCPIAEHFFSGISFDPFGWITRFGQLFDKKNSPTTKLPVFVSTQTLEVVHF